MEHYVRAGERKEADLSHGIGGLRKPSVRNWPVLAQERDNGDVL